MRLTRLAVSNRYHTRANFCYTGSSVSVSNTYGYFSDKDPLYFIQDSNLINSVNPSGTSKIVHTQGQIQACFVGNVGAYNTWTPWGKVTITKTGAISFSSGE
jgi:hypothetical protein